MEKYDKPRYTARYATPIGDIFLTASENALTGLWFAGKNPPPLPEPGFSPAPARASEAVFPFLGEIMAYLDAYFSGMAPSQEKFSSFPLAPEGSSFQRRVWSRLLQIPYGKTVTYGQIAREIACEDGRPMSAQAVGGAVGRNPIGILIPCHRVVGADGSLVGFAGGLSKKEYLLALEGVRVKDHRIL